jgi:hypothetical protein
VLESDSTRNGDALYHFSKADMFLGLIDEKTGQQDNQEQHNQQRIYLQRRIRRY